MLAYSYYRRKVNYETQINKCIIVRLVLEYK